MDTHSDTHAAALLDHFGRLLGTLTIAATPLGHRQLLAWARSHGDLRVAGVEGTGSYGASLTRYLLSQHVEVLEVQRPTRQHRHRYGKSDTTDAEAAARSVQSGTHLGHPKLTHGATEMIRLLRVVRRSAIKSRTQTTNQLRALVVTSPDHIRAKLRPLSLPQLIATASRFRTASPADVSAATKLALKTLARHYVVLTAEIKVLDQVLFDLLQSTAPGLLALPGLGTDTAGALLLAAGDNPERLHSEASFAHLCGVAPVAASSGKTLRYRLNRGGNRDANRALHVVALSRMTFDPDTCAYVSRRTSEGKTKPEIIRCLKRYIARQVYKYVT